ncbi:fimbrillin family protein [Sphingobacterium rhinopitheci]|uniref:fimbrillin family protein n=1 Tax=Sphingobacterium rhinopitheci TaxID=2781960 RepID=UPI001F5269D1|nr:fimbrillin family protein [Sphingobacterium rhinopitheci]MCI0922723.1 fimbrillin family protein [Sphingobacterium rhinopitheci]
MMIYSFFKYWNAHNFGFLVLLLFLVTQQSCSKHNLSDSDINILVKIKSVSSSFANPSMDSRKRSSTEHSNTSLYNDGIQRNTISLNKDYIIVSELIPDPVPSVNMENSIVKKANVASISPVINGVMYKLLVYNESGDLVVEQNYTVGTLDNQKLLLNSGSTYTFVAVSLNSTSLPTVSNKATLNTATVIPSTQVMQDLMYYSVTKTLDQSSVNDLDINFSHAFSRITVMIDATDSGYGITDVNSTFSSGYRTNSLKLSNMQITQSGPTNSNAVIFPTLNQEIVVSTPLIVSAQSGFSNTFLISDITINNIEANDINLFENMEILAGYSYTLRLKITPEDAIIDNTAVRINGKIWKRHNLGADYTQSADVVGAESTRGNIYQWGRNIVCVYPDDLIDYGDPQGNNPLNWFSTNNMDAESWNATLGTAEEKELNPTKGLQDPCPDGFRVPTAPEFLDLVDATLHTATLTEIDKMGASKMTSKRNKNVFLTLPYQGLGNIYRSSNNLDYDMVVYIRYVDKVNLYTSYYNNENKTYPSIKVFEWTPTSTSSNAIIHSDDQLPNTSGNTLRAFAIRCIGI